MAQDDRKYVKSHYPSVGTYRKPFLVFAYLRKHIKTQLLFLKELKIFYTPESVMFNLVELLIAPAFAESVWSFTAKIFLTHKP